MTRNFMGAWLPGSRLISHPAYEEVEISKIVQIYEVVEISEIVEIA